MLLEKLVDRLSRVASANLSDAVKDKARACILDALACSYGGLGSGPSRLTLASTRELDGPGPATVWGLGIKRPLLSAVFANGVTSHATTQEDNHADSSTHPGSMIVPAALAVAELCASSGGAVLEAVVAGYEALGQVGRLACTNNFAEHRWRASSTFGPFGSAAAAGRLLDLNAGQMEAALGLAANTACGLREWSQYGSEENSYQNATAARNGVQSALLAAGGAESARTTLEGRRGFLMGFCGEVPASFDGWPQTSEFEIEQVYFKRYTASIYMQETIEAARRLVENHRVRAEDIRRIHIKTYRRAAEYLNQGPFNGAVRALVSIPFTVAAMIADGDLTPSAFDRFDDPKLLDLAKRITLELDPVAEQQFPEIKRSTLIVELVDGRIIEEEASDLRYGTLSDIEAKFRRNATPVLGADGAERIVREIGRLEHLDRAADFTELLSAVVV